MKGVMLLNGDPYEGEIDVQNALVYCCDGAYKWAHGRVRTDKTVGDFDSLGYVPDPVHDGIYPAEKNFTDGEIALLELMEKGVDQIEIYGGGGGREDHFLGNLHLLYRAHAGGAECKMITARSVIFPASGKIFLGDYAGKTVSVLPFGGSLNIMDFRGLKYSYPESVRYGECRGISNVVLSGDAYICTEGVALIIVNRGEV